MVIFSGIQPTGTKHLGNYIGGFLQYVAGQDRGDPSIYCIVDLHSITVDYDAAQLRERTYDLFALFVAAGLDPERSILFRQSDVKEHTELAWLLSSVIPLGELNRMHQFRDKSVQQREMVRSGLLFYPVLMAADVLAYRAHEVPVGEDQREHLEVMRDAARTFNARYGETLVVPEARFPQVGARVLDLQEPDPQDVHDGRHRAGDRLRARRARRRAPQVQARADRLGARDRARRRQARHHQPDRDPGRGARRRPGRHRARVRGPRLRRPQDAPSATRSPTGWRRCASATTSCARDEARSRSCSPRAPSAPGRSPRRWWPTCATRWASGRARRSVGPAA